MGHHLNRLPQIVALALPFYDGLIDTPRGDGVVASSLNTGKPFVMPQVKVGFHTIYCHIAFAVLIGIQCSRVDIDVGVEFLNGDFIAPGLKQFSDTGGNNSLTQ